jgi:HlyD family secretion protein
MRMRIVGALMLVAIAGCREPEPTGRVRVSGHVEATEVQVSAEVGGRVVEVHPVEGDRVARGDVVARLDARDIELQLTRARADRAGAEAQFRFLQSGARPQDIRHAQAQVAAATADVAALETEVKAAATDLARFESLLQANAGSQKQRDDARARVDLARERERGARERERAAQEFVSRLQAGAHREELQAARARVAAMDAQIAILEKAVGDTSVMSPADGIVTQKLVEAGEAVAPRMPLLVVTDLDHAWANLFVPEPIIPRVKLGQPATVFTDAGGEGLQGKVTYVSPRAEFTPRNVQTADERSKLVYRIKVSVDNSAGVLKSGMPVDAELAVP